MSNYEVGYGKPPKSSQFKPGISGNRKGRPKRGPPDFARAILDVLNAPIEYREGDKVKTASGLELNVKMLVKRAMAGDVDASIALLKIRAQALRGRASGSERLEITDWTPDFPGQTAEEKTRDFARKQNASSFEWWTAKDPSNGI